MLGAVRAVCKGQAGTAKADFELHRLCLGSQVIMYRERSQFCQQKLPP